MNYTKIKKRVGESRFYQGRNLLEDGDVVDYEMYDDYIDSVYIETTVLDGRRYYDAAVSYNIDKDEFEEEYCECLNSKDGICKHIAAAMLAFMENDYNSLMNEINGSQLSFDQFLNDLNDMEEDDEEFMEPTSVFKSVGASTVSKSVATTKELKNYLIEKKNKQLENVKLVAPRKEENLVKLEPCLTFYMDHVSVEFKIGIDKMYVLKDVCSFIDAIENKRQFTYGKNLSFIHTMDAFDLKSQKLIDFIRMWLETNKHNYNYGYYYYYAPKIKELDLMTDDFEDFLRAMNGYFLLVKIYSEQKWYQICNTVYRPKIWIKGHDNYLEIRGEEYLIVMGARYNIFITDDKILYENILCKEEIQDILDIIKSTGKATIVAQEDIPFFCQNVLPLLKETCDVEIKDFNEEDFLLLKCSFELYLDMPQKEFITCKALAIYGEKKYNIYSKENEANRNILEERTFLKQIADMFNAYDERNQELVLAQEDDEIYNFLKTGIEKMKELCQVYVSEKIKRMQIIESPKVEVGVSLQGDLLDINVTATEMSLEQLAEVLSKYNVKKKYYRLQSGDYIIPDDKQMEQLKEMSKMLGMTSADWKEGHKELPKFRALYMDQFEKSEAFYLEKNEHFTKLVQEMDFSIEKQEKYKVPKELEGILRPYQKIGFQWLKTLSDLGFGGILADDMGLGKTLQVISYILSEQMEVSLKSNDGLMACSEKTSKKDIDKNALIVCPASLVYNWQNEFATFAEGLDVTVVNGSQEYRQQLIHNSRKNQILITSYDLLKRDIEYYEGKNFYCQIIDEAQYIKNHGTQVAKSVKKINATHKFALTGTPIENRVSELWSIFDFLMPGVLYSYTRFHQDFEMPIMTHGDASMKEKLRRMIGSFILRRLKNDVLKDLPEKMEESIICKMEGKQQKLYDAHVQRLRILLGKQNEEEFKHQKIQILSEITRLRQICCDPSLVYSDYDGNSSKRVLCMEVIKRAIDGEHKILIFSQFTSMFDLLIKNLEEEGISYYLLTGATPKEKRVKMVEQFNQNEVPVFLISLKAGGTGLNLTGADIVIHYDPWWNVAVQNQATDRAHRIGQKNVVTVYKLVMKNTIEEKVVKLQEMKQQLAVELLSGDNVSSSILNREDLLALL